ncbi:MAG TPA: hypothetical protein VFC30_09220 [Solirubrobacteraceae bacterium]|nr:hypothetical protein [Solirubrobacteraceae bacterium]
MFAFITVALVIFVALANAFRPGRRGDLITSRPYSNRHNPASGAREDLTAE